YWPAPAPGSTNWSSVWPNSRPSRFPAAASSNRLPGAASDPSPSPRERSEAVIYPAPLMELRDVRACQRAIPHAPSVQGRMSLAVTLSRAQEGIAAPQVMVEVHLSGGLPCTNIVGLPEAAVREARDRV